ncbi:MAG: CBS domain-containing protein, partial [Treponema sp.]|nr:CBS domain-containing protein [Treponema sp.]
MIISRVMTKNPIFVHPDMPVTEARSLMEREQIGHLPVLDKNNRLAGIVTKKDLLKAGPSPATSLDMYEISYLLSKLKVEKIMEKKVITVDENEVVEEA